MGGDVRVLMVSIGAFEKGPMAPEMRPMPICWYDGNSVRSGCNLCANFLISWYAVKFAPIRIPKNALGLSRLKPQKPPRTLVRSLPECRQRNPTIQRQYALFSYDGIDRMTRVSIPGYFEGVREGVGLSLESDFDYFHWRDDGYCFSRSRSDPGCVLKR